MGTLKELRFPQTMKSYSQPSGVSAEQVQSLMEWLFASLLNAGYHGKSHLIWYDSNNPDPSLEQVVQKLIRRGEPVFIFRCGDRTMPLPQQYYWQMMEERPSMRIYQLEAK